jgi:hypothetical protein
VRAIILIYFLPSLIVFNLTISVAQEKKDSVERKSMTKKAFHEGLKLITTNSKDTILNENSINPYAQHAGKIIRNINIDRIGFEKSIYDSAKKVDKTITKLANKLHIDTRLKIIRKHLFIRENQALNPHELADNERFLRDKDFILDCRIIVTPIENTDSVDVLVVTRDVFSLGGSLGGTIPTAPKIRLYDANVDGRGQRIEYTALIDQERTPKYGYSLVYRKSSVLGSLTNLELGYTELNSGYSFGDENEFALRMRLDRPLVSPYTRLAGGGEVSRNWSENVYGEPDSTFLKYQYKVVDGWIGYNIGIHKDIADRSRKFLALRFVDGYYIDQPDQVEYLQERKYNNIYGYLSEFTFYEKNYYKTRYVYGFGRTEDVPYGYTLGISAGYVRQLGIERPYAAIKWDYGKAFTKGDFVRLITQVGGYYRDNKMEDVIVQGGATYFARLLQLNRFKLRNLAQVTYTQLTNRTAIDYLNISKKEIPGFSSDSIRADQRLALHAESVLYTPWTLLGFRFAPFVSLDLVTLNCVQCATDNEVYTGLSSGLRTRNENLIFGTMEVKFTYIPKDQYGNSKFVFGFKQNLQVKNTGSFVKAPSFILYNN